MSNKKLYVIGVSNSDNKLPKKVSNEQYLVKIGISRNPEQRLSSLKVGSPEPLILWTTIKVDDPNQVEFSIHECFKDRHKRGEWYYLTWPELVLLGKMDKYIVDNAPRSIKYIKKYDKGCNSPC